MAEQDPTPEGGDKPATPETELETEDQDQPPQTDAEPEPEPDEEDVDLDDVDEEAGEDGEDQPEPPKGRGGANERIQRLTQENRRLKAAERRFQDMVERGGRREPDPVEQQRQYEQQQKTLLEQAQAAEDMGDRGAVARYWADRRANETNFRIQQAENRAFEREDARDFRALCREEGIKPDLREWVEDFVSKARANGNYMLTREAALNHRLGQLARQGRNGSLAQQRERGERRILRQTVKPPRGGSDARATGRRKPESEWTAEDYERQLANRPLTGG